MLSSNNSFNFSQPIVQTQNAMGDGNQQSLNLAYNIPINVGMPTQPPAQPQMPYYPPPAQPQPYYPPPQPYCPPPQMYCPPQQPYCPPPVQIPQQPILLPQPIPVPQPVPIPRPVPVPVPVPVPQPQQPPQQPHKQDNSFQFVLLLILLMLGKRKSSNPVTIGNNVVNNANNVQRKNSPLAFDLNGDGVKTSNNKIRFDINGDGRLDLINDVSREDGTLTIDSDRDGKSGENGAELLGDNTNLSRFGINGRFKDGFDALKAIAEDAKRRGLINRDNVLDADELKILEREYGLKMKVGGLNSRAGSLADAGIQSINLSNGKKTYKDNFDGQGNDILNQEGADFTKTGGGDGTYGDIFFRYD